jgi:hypothetical protein
MGLVWHMAELLEASGMDVHAFESTAGFKVPPAWLGSTPPPDMRLDMVELICETLGRQPGELLTLEAKTPSAMAERNLAGDLFYQSYLAHREAQQGE